MANPFVADISTLAQMMANHSALTTPLFNALNGLGLTTAANYVQQIYKERVDSTKTFLDELSLQADQYALSQAIKAVADFVEDTAALSDVKFLIDTAFDQDVSAANTAYAKLVTDRLNLSLTVKNTLAGPPPLPPDKIDPAPSGSLTFDKFNSYLDGVEGAIQFIRDNDTPLPSANSLKIILDSWRTAIETQLPKDTSDGAVPPPPGPLPPTRAQLVAQYIAVDSRVSALIDDITDILSDRNLEDLTIL